MDNPPVSPHLDAEQLLATNRVLQKRINELTQLTSDMDNLLKSSQIGTLFLDRQLRVRMFTPAIACAFHVLDQDIGRPVEHLEYRFSDAQWLDDVRQVLSTGTSVEREVSNGEGETYLQRVTPYRNSMGELCGAVLVYTNITAPKQILEAQQLNQELKRANNDLQDFAYAVSHDLQAPLRHVVGACREIDERLDPQLRTPDTQRDLHVLQTSATRMTNMIQGLLTYSRVSTRGNPFGPFDGEETFARAKGQLAEEIRRTNATITHDPLPSLVGDRGQIERVFLHLLDNSMKYTKQRPVVHLTCEVVNGVGTFSLTDNGIGIEERHHERIFIIFQRLGFMPEVDGDGLGLPLSKRMIERHGGRIWCESVPGHGATFRFTLPARNGTKSG